MSDVFSKSVKRQKAISSAPVISIEDEYFEHESPQSETKRRKTQFVLDSVVEVSVKVKSEKTVSNKRHILATQLEGHLKETIEDPEERLEVLRLLNRRVAGKLEADDKARLGVAILESLTEFEKRMRLDNLVKYNTDEKVLGAHIATVPRKDHNLDREYERHTGFSRHRLEDVRAMQLNPSKHHRLNSISLKGKPRGQFTINLPKAKEFAREYWNKNVHPRMLGTGEKDKVFIDSLILYA